jgi:hypothetical protein
MLTENEVVDTMCDLLRGHGYGIESCCHDTERGDDIVAVAQGSRRLHVECKGAVSRKGNRINAWREAGGALFNAIRDIEKPGQPDDVAVAFPDVVDYHNVMDGLESFCKREKLLVYWVNENRSVRKW